MTFASSPTPGSIAVDNQMHSLRGHYRMTVGRSEDCDIAVDLPGVADHHLTVEWRGQHWYLVAAPGALVFRNGVARRLIAVDAAQQVYLGDPRTGPVLAIATEPATTHDGFSAVDEKLFGSREHLGRADPSNGYQGNYCRGDQDVWRKR